MAWTPAIDIIVENAFPVERTYLLEIRNGYQADAGEVWTEIEIRSNGWGITITDGNPVIGTSRFDIGVKNWSLLEEFNHANPVQLIAACKFSGIVETPGGPETEYLFRGTIRTLQIIDSKFLIEAVCPMAKLKKVLAPVDMTADISGPHTEVRLRPDPTGIYDEPGTFYTYEINPITNCPGPLCQDWCENIFGTNRAFVPGTFEVEMLVGAVWEPIAVSEYIVDEPLGLIRFANDTGGAASYRLISASVYIEGTLELADVIEYMLSIPDDCEHQGCGFTESQLITNLAGTITFNAGGPPWTVTGIGTSFLTDLEIGDRIGFQGPAPIIAIVAGITNDLLLNIRFPYDQIGGVVPSGPGAYFVCGLKESGISLSKILWLKCDGTAAELYRKLQQNYADSKGYKIWYDHENDKVRGRQVRAMRPTVPAELAKIVDLGPVLKNGLNITSTSEDFATAVTVTGLIGRAKNLITDPAVVLTPLAELAGWSIFAGSHGGINWGPIGVLVDQDMSTGYAAYLITPPGVYHEFIKIDLGAIYDLSEFILYRINTKETGNFSMGVSLYGASVDIPGSYTPLSPEAIQFEMTSDEEKHLDLEGIATNIRFIIIECRPFSWVHSGHELTMGFRELIIYGSQEICITACVQSDMAPGVRQLGIGNIIFNAGGPPYTVTGVLTQFGAVGQPQVGDYIAHTLDLDHWAIISQINAATGPNCVELVYQYGGILPSGPAGLRFSDGDPPYAEGEGGHFIGGSTDPDYFKRDYYPHLIKKITNFGHSTKLDDQGLVFTEAQAKDRAYIILDEVIRIYRTIKTKHGFDPRIKIFDTVHAVDNYRATADENLYFLVQGINLNDGLTEFAGTEYGAGVLE